MATRTSRLSIFEKVLPLGVKAETDLFMASLVCVVNGCASILKTSYVIYGFFVYLGMFDLAAIIPTCVPFY